MLTEQRFEIICRLVNERGSITVTELKDILDTSESTVRRENISPDIMRKNRPPSSAPRRSVRRPTWRSLL